MCEKIVMLLALLPCEFLLSLSPHNPHIAKPLVQPTTFKWLLRFGQGGGETEERMNVHILVNAMKNRTNIQNVARQLKFRGSQSLKPKVTLIL